MLSKRVLILLVLAIYCMILTSAQSPTFAPTESPTYAPTHQPTGQPTGQPTRNPTGQPSSSPSRHPTGQPSGTPTGQPSHRPTGTIPTGEPSSAPSILEDLQKPNEGVWKTFGWRIVFVVFLILACFGSVLLCYLTDICSCPCWSPEMAYRNQYLKGRENLSDRPSFVIKIKTIPTPAQGNIVTEQPEDGQGQNQSVLQCNTSERKQLSMTMRLKQWFGCYEKQEGIDYDYVKRERDDIDIRTDVLERRLMINKAKDRYSANRGLPAFLESGIMSINNTLDLKVSPGFGDSGTANGKAIFHESESDISIMSRNIPTLITTQNERH